MICENSCNKKVDIVTHVNKDHEKTILERNLVLRMLMDKTCFVFVYYKNSFARDWLALSGGFIGLFI